MSWFWDLVCIRSSVIFELNISVSVYLFISVHYIFPFWSYCCSCTFVEQSILLELLNSTTKIMQQTKPKLHHVLSSLQKESFKCTCFLLLKLQAITSTTILSHSFFPLFSTMEIILNVVSLSWVVFLRTCGVLLCK